MPHSSMRSEKHQAAREVSSPPVTLSVSAQAIPPVASGSLNSATGPWCEKSTGTRLMTSAARLSDHKLIKHVKRLARTERRVTASLVAHLAVLDERRLYLGEGCSSLFTYCTQVLRLSEHAAYGRIEAARAARRFPAILEMLAAGSVTLTTVTLLAPHLTPDNHAEVLRAAHRKSRRQVEELIAVLRPLPPVPSSIRRLPAAAWSPVSDAVGGAVLQSALAPSAAGAPARVQPAVADAVATVQPAVGGDAVTRQPGGPDGAVPIQHSGAKPGPHLSRPDSPPESKPTPHLAGPASSPEPAMLPPSRRDAVTPLAPERYKIQFTASAGTCEKLRLAQDLLRHQIPNGELGQVIDRALTLLLEMLLKQKFAATERATHRAAHRSGAPVPTPSRHIPAEVRRAVWIRDGGRCAFVSHTGHRCQERGFLEFHHKQPYGAGGEATVDNIELRCRTHNAYEADLFFGRDRQMTVREPSPPFGSAALQPRAPSRPSDRARAGPG